MEAAGLAVFVETLRVRALFERGASVSISRAPGRLDVMGGIADYSGSLVLERPIAEAAWAAAQRLDRPLLEIVSLGRPACTIPLDALAPGGVPASYDDTRRMFEASPCRWAAYVAGVVLVLARERCLPLTSGVRIAIASGGLRIECRERLRPPSAVAPLMTCPLSAVVLRRTGRTLISTGTRRGVTSDSGD